MWALAAALCSLILLYLSLHCRVWKKKVYLQKHTRELPVDPQSSLLSEAVKELIGVAGGIYLSLVMVTGFLQIEVPSRVPVAGLQIDPLAAVAVFLAIVQPLLDFRLVWR